MTDQKTPKSEMIRVPTALIPAVKQLSHLHRQAHTIALLQGLEELINQFDSNIDSDIAPSSKSIKQLEAKLETKLEVITKKLEQMERAIASGRHNNTRSRRPPHPYLQPRVLIFSEKLSKFFMQFLCRQLRLKTEFFFSRA